MVYTPAQAGSHGFPCKSTKVRASLAVRLLLLLLLSLQTTAGEQAVLNHRCIHAHSHALGSVAQSAARLDVKLTRSSTSNQNAIDPAIRVPSQEVAVHVAASRVASKLAAASPPTDPPIRIHFDVSHLYNGDHFCGAVGLQRGDKLGGNVTCSDDDLFSAWKRDFVLERVLPVLGSSVEQWLSLRGRDSVGSARDAAVTHEDVVGADGSRVMVPQGVCGKHVVVPAAHSITGVQNTDFVVYVLAAPLHDAVTTANPRASASTSSRTVAWATYCAVDQRTDRPLVAMINFVPSSLVIREASAASAAGAAPPRWQQSLRRWWRHRFSSSSEDADNSEKRLRSAVDNANDVIDAYYAQWTAQHTRSLLHELLHALGFAPRQLQRHLKAVSTKQTTPAAQEEAAGTRTTMVIASPKVTAAVQDWMNCTDTEALPGAALEQSGPEGTVGAHWERLYFHDDLMAGVLSSTAALSGMTLALLDSLPYYRANRLYAEHAMWGYQAGCAFAAGKCTPLKRFAAFDAVRSDEKVGSHATSSRMLDVDSLTQLRYWCEATASSSSAGHAQCTSDRRAIGFCFAQRGAGSKRGSKVGPSFGTPPSPSTVERQGLSMLMEGCPIVEPYSNRLCDTTTMLESAMEGTSASTAAAGAAEADVRSQRQILMEGQGYYFGPYSRCFASSDIRQLDRASVRTLDMHSAARGHANDTVRLSLGNGTGRTPASHRLVTARCLQTRCVHGGSAVELRVGNEWIACPPDGRAGVVSVPPTSGYMGWVGCEAAELYCGDAAQLQPPSQLLNATLMEPKRDESLRLHRSPLPLYRVTICFGVLMSAYEAANPLVEMNSASALSSERPLGAVSGLAAAAALRMALVKSDRAFQTALERDLARHRALLGLTPLGAVIEQRVVGATRLTSAAFAVFAGDVGNASGTSPFPSRWEAVVLMDLEVVARDTDEALASTQAWLSVTKTDTAATSAAALTPQGVRDDACLSVNRLPLTAEWLSRGSCVAALLADRAEGSKRRVHGGVDDEAGAVPTSPSVLPIDAIEAVPNAARPASCQVRGGLVEPQTTWDVSVPSRAASFSVRGPLDVSELRMSTRDLQAVAVLHLRLRFGDGDTAALAKAAAGSAEMAQAFPVDVEQWVSRAATLLALTKDVGALLGVSAQWVRAASIRHAANSEKAAVGSATTPVAQHTETPAATTAAQRAIDIGIVVSLPTIDEVPSLLRAEDGASTPLSWTEFTALAREKWHQLLRDSTESCAEVRSVCPLRNANVLFEEALSPALVQAMTANSTSASRCFVGLEAVLNVHAPQPGASVEDVFVAAGSGAAPPWWARRVMTVRGFSVSVGAFIVSVVAATVMLLCTLRCY